uniref:Secreted protein n=1 Tax=Ixodes ricinus TaxID=34613 RepID=A0A6B0UQS5_IXORI
MRVVRLLTFLGTLRVFETRTSLGAGVWTPVGWRGKENSMRASERRGVLARATGAYTPQPPRLQHHPRPANTSRTRVRESLRVPDLHTVPRNTRLRRTASVCCVQHNRFTLWKRGSVGGGRRGCAHS